MHMRSPVCMRQGKQLCASITHACCTMRVRARLPQAVLWCSASLRPLAHLSGHTGRIHALSFNPRGTVLASAGDDCGLRLWSVPDGSVQANMRFNYFGFTW